MALAFLLIAAGLIAALPWLLRIPAAQRRMAALANNLLAPSSVEFSAIRLSWFQPTEITNVVLHDAQGDRLLAAPRATFGWNLRQMLVNRPKEATLTIQQGDLDIERFADGTVDLYETLKPVISEHPTIRLIIDIRNGRLRFRDPVFSDPVVADRAHFLLNLGRSYEPITWDIKLAQSQATGEPGRLDLVGNYSRAEVDPSGRHDLTLALKGSRWPWSLANSMVQARGELTGNLDGQMRMGRVRLDGDATITNLVAIGELLSSDTVHLDTVRGQLRLEGGDDSWTIDRLDLTSPVASLRGQGSIPPTPKNGAWLEAVVDLAAVAKQLPGTLHLRDDLRVEHGTARLRADIERGTDGHTQDWKVTGKVSDLAARQGQKLLTIPEPATLAARLQRNETAMKLERLDVQTSFLTATGQGDLDRGITLAAALDLAALRERFRDWIDLGQVELAGKGTIDARYARQGEEYSAGLSAAFRALRIGGLPLVERIERDQFNFEGTIGGPATVAGWPRSWKAISLRASSEKTEVRLQAHSNEPAGEIGLSGRATTQVVFDGREQRVEGELQAKSSQATWTADRLALAVVRASKWGPGIAPDESIRWEGRGRYDPQRDELVIESTARPPRPPSEHETWIYGDQRLRASGLKSPSVAQVELAANTKLASLGRWLAPQDPPWKGQLSTLVQARRELELWNLGLRLEMHDPERTAVDGSKMGLPGSVTLSLNAGYTPRTDRLELSELSVQAPYLQVEGAGTVRAVTSRAVLDLRGSLNPDWRAIRGLLTRKVEPNAKITGRSRPWRLAGTIEGLPAIDRMGSLEGEIGTQIDSLDVFGMRLSGVPVVLRAEKGRLGIDPIDARLNGGVLHIEPELVRDKDGSTWLHLGPASRLDGAIVNDEVSHRVLSFAAPILDGATRVEGRVSLSLGDAFLPILAAPGAQARIEGDVLFDDVRFMPGPLAEQLLSVFQRERRPLAVVRDPIAVRIAGRKVYQEGLAIPVGKIASIGLDGSVDFDQNLDMIARFALNPPRSNLPVLTPILEKARFELPIRGTLKNPKIDAEALKEHWRLVGEQWKSIGIDLLENSMEAGVNGLQRLLQGFPVPGLRRLIPPTRRAAPPRPSAGPDSTAGQVPGDQGAPPADHEALKPPERSPDRAPPLTADERRQLREQRRQDRLQKKADRRLKHALPPG